MKASKNTSTAGQHNCAQREMRSPLVERLSARQKEKRQGKKKANKDRLFMTASDLDVIFSGPVLDSFCFFFSLETRSERCEAGRDGTGRGEAGARRHKHNNNNSSTTARPQHGASRDDYDSLSFQGSSFKGSVTDEASVTPSRMNQFFLELSYCISPLILFTR